MLGARGAESSGVGVGHSVPSLIPTEMLPPHSPTVQVIAVTALHARSRPPPWFPLCCPSCPVRSQCCPFSSTSPRCLSTSVQASASLPSPPIIASRLLCLQAHVSTLQALHSHQYLIMSHSCSKTSHGSLQLHNKVQPSHSIQGLPHPT